MNKFFEKKNFGIPSSILCIIAYILGYNVAEFSVYAILPLLVFVTAVFAYQFEDRVEVALKQSLAIGFIAYVIRLCLYGYNRLITLIRPSDYYGEGIHYVLQKIYEITSNVVGFAVVVVFAVLIISVLVHKDLKIKVLTTMSLDTPQVCPKCGTQNQGGVAFCANCGTSMKKSE